MQSLPATIPNLGNTCFAAAWMQIVATNRLLSGAYRTMLKPWDLIAKIFGQHYAVQILDQYRIRQMNPSSPINISSLRYVFGANQENQQEDAAELSQKIHGQMKMPIDGKIQLEDGTMDQFGCRIRTWMPLSQQWRPYNPSANGQQNYSLPVLSLNFSSESASTSLSNMVAENYLNEYTRIKFLDSPNTLVFNICRQAYAENGVQVDSRPVYAPLFFELPPGLLESQKSPRYILHGFVSHNLGSAAEGHYVAYVQAAGKFYKMNDGIRTQVGMHEFLQAAKTAYTLNYSKTE